MAQSWSARSRIMNRFAISSFQTPLEYFVVFCAYFLFLLFMCSHSHCVLSPYLFEPIKTRQLLKEVVKLTTENERLDTHAKALMSKNNELNSQNRALQQQLADAKQQLAVCQSQRKGKNKNNKKIIRKFIHSVHSRLLIITRHDVVVDVAGCGRQRAASACQGPAHRRRSLGLIVVDGARRDHG